jgi:hypothetical protein
MKFRLIRCVLRQTQLGPPHKCIALHDMDLWSLALAVAFCSSRANGVCMSMNSSNAVSIVRIAYHHISM